MKIVYYWRPCVRGAAFVIDGTPCPDAVLVNQRNQCIDLVASTVYEGAARMDESQRFVILRGYDFEPEDCLSAFAVWRERYGLRSAAVTVDHFCAGICDLRTMGRRCAALEYANRVSEGILSPLIEELINPTSPLIPGTDDWPDRVQELGRQDCRALSAFRFRWLRRMIEFGNVSDRQRYCSLFREIRFLRDSDAPARPLVDVIPLLPARIVRPEFFAARRLWCTEWVEFATAINRHVWVNTTVTPEDVSRITEEINVKSRV